MWPKQIKRTYFYELECLIKKLPKNTTFSLESLLLENVKNIKPYELKDTISEFKYYIRVDKKGITEISDSLFKVAEPKFSKNPNVYKFTVNTSVQELFHYVLALLDSDLICNKDYFQVRELFPGYIWNRFSQQQKMALGNLVEMYNRNEGGSSATYALINRTKQGQNVYRSLNNLEEMIYDDWFDVDMSNNKLNKLK